MTQKISSQRLLKEKTSEWGSLMMHFYWSLDMTPVDISNRSHERLLLADTVEKH